MRGQGGTCPENLTGALILGTCPDSSGRLYLDILRAYAHLLGLIRSYLDIFAHTVPLPRMPHIPLTYPFTFLLTASSRNPSQSTPKNTLTGPNYKDIILATILEASFTGILI